MGAATDPVIGYTDFRREADGGVTAVPQTAGGPGERCAVRVAVESQVTRADGSIEPAREVASSDVPDGEVGAVRFG